MEIYGFMGLWVYEAPKKLFSIFLAFSSQRLYCCFFYRLLSSSSFPLAFRIPLRLAPLHACAPYMSASAWPPRVDGRAGALAACPLPRSPPNFSSALHTFRAGRIMEIYGFMGL